jgi:hypothetical protein
MNLESAKPAVDQPVAKVDVRWVRKSDGGCHFNIMAWSTAATLVSFIISKQEIMDLQDKENKKGILQFIYTKEGTKFSRMRT